MAAACYAFLDKARWLALAGGIAAAAPAYAGRDCDPEAAVKDLEAAAKDKAKAADAERNYSFLCAEGLAAKWKPRVGKACEKILARDGEKGNPCVVVAASAGFTNLGKSGDAAANTFLEEQAKATVDTHVRDACNDAAAAIAKRSK